MARMVPATSYRYTTAAGWRRPDSKEANGLDRNRPARGDDRPSLRMARPWRLPPAKTRECPQSRRPSIAQVPDTFSEPGQNLGKATASSALEQARRIATHKREVAWPPLFAGCGKHRN